MHPKRVFKAQIVRAWRLTWSMRIFLSGPAYNLATSVGSYLAHSSWFSGPKYCVKYFWPKFGAFDGLQIGENAEMDLNRPGFLSPMTKAPGKTNINFTHSILSLYLLSYRVRPLSARKCHICLAQFWIRQISMGPIPPKRMNTSDNFVPIFRPSHPNN